MIEKYEFGKIIYNGNIYKSDLIICPNKIIFPWWRKDCHSLELDDLKEISDYNFDMIIIGQGFSSEMRIKEEVIEYINKKKQYNFIGSTAQSCNVFNQYFNEKKVIGIFHLTC